MSETFHTRLFLLELGFVDVVVNGGDLRVIVESRDDNNDDDSKENGSS